MNTYSPTYSDDDDEMGDIVEAYAEQEASDRPSVTDNAHDEEPLAWCPGCGDRIPTEVIRERGVCSNCYGTSDDPWATDQALAEAWAEGHRTGWEHCQDGNYGSDYWDDPTPNPYAAAARRSNTIREGQDMRPEDAPQDAQYSVVVHQLDCPCGDGNNRFAEFKDGCRVDVYPATPPQAGGFGPAVGYVQMPPKVSMLTAEELFGNKG